MRWSQVGGGDRLDLADISPSGDYLSIQSSIVFPDNSGTSCLYAVNARLVVPHLLCAPDPRAWGMEITRTALLALRKHPEFARAAGTRRVAGVDAVCYQGTFPADVQSTVCLSDQGVPLYLDSRYAGQHYRFEAEHIENQVGANALEVPLQGSTASLEVDKKDVPISQLQLPDLPIVKAWQEDHPA
jgi:hypothetical protein